MAYTAKQAHEFAKTLALSPEKQHAAGVKLALMADRGYESPASALAAMKYSKRAGKKAEKAAKGKLVDRGFKELICHGGEFISAYGWQINNRPSGNIDSHGNGRYLVAEIEQSTGNWVDSHGHQIIDPA